jgi:hypothetical protein
MHFGFRNAPAAFERLMEIVLRGPTYSSFIVYLDNVFVSGHSTQEYLLNLRKLFQRLRKAHLKHSTEKCHLFRKDVRYLGLIVSSKGIIRDPENWKMCRNVQPIRMEL